MWMIMAVSKVTKHCELNVKTVGKHYAARLKRYC